MCLLNGLEEKTIKVKKETCSLKNAAVSFSLFFEKSEISVQIFSGLVTFFCFPGFSVKKVKICKKKVLRKISPGVNGNSFFAIYVRWLML